MNDAQYQALIRRVRLLEKREPPLAAEFIDTAATPADDLRVVARGWDEGEHAFGPVRWSPIGGALPQAGDEAVIVERDDGVWQVVGWWSDSQDTGVAQSAVDALEDAVAALDVRVDALEARPAYARGSGTVTFASSAFSNTVTVPHGLGVTPGSVQITGTQGAGVNFQSTKDATNIYVTGDYPHGTLNQTINFDWFAVI